MTEAEKRIESRIFGRIRPTLAPVANTPTLAPAGNAPELFTPSAYDQAYGRSPGVLPYFALGVCCPMCSGDLLFFPLSRKFTCAVCPPGSFKVAGKVVRL